MTASCPRCLQVLDASQADGIDARTCPTCHGMLLRHADLGRAVESGSFVAPDVLHVGFAPATS